MINIILLFFLHGGEGGAVTIGMVWQLKFSNNKKMLCIENLKIQKPTTYHNIQCWWSCRKMKMLSLLVGMWAFTDLPVILPSHKAEMELGHLNLCSSKNLLSAARSAVSRPFPAVIASRIHLSFQAMALQPPASNYQEHGRGAGASAILPHSGLLW